MKTLILVGDDKIGHRLISRLGSDLSVITILDKSSNIKRVLRLCQRGSLKIRWLMKMINAEITRKKTNTSISKCIKTNDELLNIINQFKIEMIFLFRSGLIIDKKILNFGISIINTHCARIPDYGGIGAIARALEGGAYEQFATIHRVTESIDRGEILAIEPYVLDPSISYRKNEDIAYDAGIRLLLNFLHERNILERQ